MPLFNSQPWRSILRDLSLVENMCCLVHSLWKPKTRSTAETVVKRKVVNIVFKFMMIMRDAYGSNWSTADKEKTVIISINLLAWSNYKLARQGIGCLITINGCREVAVKEPNLYVLTTVLLRWVTIPLPHRLHLPQLWRESGTHLLLSEQKKLLKNPVLEPLLWD